MTTLTFPNAAGPIVVPTQAVYTRAAWSDAWTLQPDLWCQRLTRATGETLSAAEFRYRYGTNLAPGASVWAAKPVTSVGPLTYVRVVATGAGGGTGFEWWGLWRAATLNDVDQVFEAVGLEQALDQPCVDSPWWDGTAVVFAGCGLSFNARGKKNRSAAKHTVNGKSVYTFEPDESVASHWSTRDAVEMLLAMAAPKKADGTVIWNWTPANLTQLPDWDTLRLDTDGVSYLQLLRSIVTRYRLTMWCVEPSGGSVQIRFDCFAETAIDIKDGTGATIGTIPANTSQDTLVCLLDQSSRVSLATEASHVCDQVIVVGARKKRVFTLSTDDDTWTKLWTIALQNEYDDAASSAGDYPTDQDLQDARDQDARNSERLRCVYSHFGPAPDWDQELQGLYFLGTSAPGVQLKLYRPLLEFLERLPLRSGYRYDDTRINDMAGTPGHRGEVVADVPHEDLPTLAWVRVVAAAHDDANKDRWQLMDQLGRNRDLEQIPDRTVRCWSGEVRRLRDKLGVEIRTQGEQQHVIAKHENLGTSLEIEGAVDWGANDQDILVTVCVEDPRRYEHRWPADADVTPVGDLVRRIRIEDDQYQEIYVYPNTKVDTDPTTLELRDTTGGYLQDDADEMLAIAQRTYEWHKTPRYALRFSSGWVTGALQIGHLITQIIVPAGTFPVLSVISEITVDWPIGTGGTPQRPTISVATAFGELDARRVV